jgi:hypothetical protein
MEHVPLASTNLASIGYADGVLEVSFHSGATCAYSATEDEYRAFLAAPSPGKHFAAHFRSRAFVRR